MLEKYNIILGSQSPRRQELLKGLDLKFTTKVIDGIEENYNSTLQGEEIPIYLAQKKASAYQLSNNDLLITADTIVWLDNKVYGKPKSQQEAYNMIKMISGKTHQVITGVCISTINRCETFAVSTNVSFTQLTDKEINYYINKYHPMDKAGSYGVQEWIGYVGVDKIEGSYYNVMGLPVQKLYHILKTFE